MCIRDSHTLAGHTMRNRGATVFSEHRRISHARHHTWVVRLALPDTFGDILGRHAQAHVRLIGLHPIPLAIPDETPTSDAGNAAIADCPPAGAERMRRSPIERAEPH